MFNLMILSRCYYLVSQFPFEDWRPTFEDANVWMFKHPHSNVGPWSSNGPMFECRCLNDLFKFECRGVAFKHQHSNVGCWHRLPKVTKVGLFQVAEAPTNRYDYPIPMFTFAILYGPILSLLSFGRAAPRNNERLSNSNFFSKF